MAIKNNPELQMLRMEVSAREAAKLQSGLSPNPEFEIEAENILGSDDLRGFSGSEITAKMSQNFLLAGKLSKSEKVAEANVSLAEWDYKEKRLEIITNVKQVFHQALSAKLLIKKNEELINISNEFLANLKKRVNAGKISPAEVSRAEIIFNSLQIELTKLQSNYHLAISELESLIYEPDFSINQLIGDLQYPLLLPGYDSLLALLENNPKLKKFESEFEKQNALLDLEEAIGVPDLTVSAGYKRSNDIGANTFLIGASIPIPLFNRNQGSIQETRIRSDQKKSEYNSIKNNLVMRLNLLYRKFNALTEIGKQLQTNSIPKAEEAFRIIKEGSLVGRFTVLDVLDAERTLFDLQNQYLNLTSEIQLVKIEIENLIAEEIN
ncbi:MAG: TolC family protein [Ignavibacteriae bacterium]|nr:TolC family protein [Ignavibacteriota bacterium]